MFHWQTEGTKRTVWMPLMKKYRIRELWKGTVSRVLGVYITLFIHNNKSSSLIKSTSRKPTHPFIHRWWRGNYLTDDRQTWQAAALGHWTRWRRRSRYPTAPMGWPPQPTGWRTWWPAEAQWMMQHLTRVLMERLPTWYFTVTEQVRKTTECCIFSTIRDKPKGSKQGGKSLLNDALQRYRGRVWLHQLLREVQQWVYMKEILIIQDKHFTLIAMLN